MTVIGVDDTDSRDRGMCTTYVAARIAASVRQVAAVQRVLLVRLNPAVPHKTRGNAALAIHTDLDPERAFELARAQVDAHAETADDRTAPGLVVAPGKPADIPSPVLAFADNCITGLQAIDRAMEVIRPTGFLAEGWKSGRGRIGALAAVGAWDAFDDWTVEHIAYRHPDRWGSPRSVDPATVFAAADQGYPAAWDTVDLGEGEAVCVPNTPGPVLYGVRGDDTAVVQQVVDGIESEPVFASELFLTNQGTDAHLQRGEIGALDGGRSYRTTGDVATPPETRPGGHVFFSVADGADRVTCAAFEPTKRFRDRVRALRPGDQVTICGEVTDGTLKLEKFAVRSLVRSEPATPECPDCGRAMESAGANQGYRCRDCGTSAPGKVDRPVDRDLEVGWYEVPPCARRHIAKPLIRGGFDAPVHPER